MVNSPDPTPTGTTGKAELLLDRLAPAAAATIILMGAYNRQLPLVALASTLLLVLLSTRFWSRYSLTAVSYHRELSDDRAFPDDEVELALRVSNGKLLPLPWLEVDDIVPAELAPRPLSGSAERPSEGGRLRLAGSASWMEKVTWRFRLNCRRRGIFTLGPASVTSGDPFGLFPRSDTLGGQDRLVVYPRLVSLEGIILPPGSPLGETKAQRWIFEDPTRSAGVREYRREDPFHRIHWKASARRQQLQVKQLEPTTTLETALFLDVGSFGSSQPQASAESSVLSAEPQPETTPQNSALSTQHSPDARWEYGVSITASMAKLLIDRRNPVGLYINGGERESQGTLQIMPGRSQGQLVQILETLAGVERGCSTPIATLVEKIGPGLPWGASIAVVAGSSSPELLAVLARLKKAGRNPVLLIIEKEDEVYPAEF